MHYPDTVLTVALPVWWDLPDQLVSGHDEAQMIRRYSGGDFNELQPKDLLALPPLAQTAGYEVLEGNPMAAIRFDVGDAQSPHQLGVWRCTPGRFACIEKGDELQTLMVGRLSLTGEDGIERRFNAGDSIYTTRGERVIWDVQETVIKVFFTHVK